jgi:hypothetical protein
MIIDTNNDIDRLRFFIVKDLLNVKESELDKHYMSSSQGSFSRREIAKEIENNTEIGKKHVENLIHLAIDMYERKYKDFVRDEKLDKLL